MTTIQEDARNPRSTFAKGNLSFYFAINAGRLLLPVHVWLGTRELPNSQELRPLDVASILLSGLGEPPKLTMYFHRRSNLPISRKEGRVLGLFGLLIQC